MNVEGCNEKGRPKKRWMHVVQKKKILMDMTNRPSATYQVIRTSRAPYFI